MAVRQQAIWGGAGGVLLLAVWLLCVRQASPQGSSPPALAKAALPASPNQVVGTASCSGRGCHGSLSPDTHAPINKDEFTTWLFHDKHASASRILGNARS